MNDRLSAGYTKTNPLGFFMLNFMISPDSAATMFPPAESPASTIWSGCMSMLQQKHTVDSVEVVDEPAVCLETVVQSIGVLILGRQPIID